MQSLLSRGLNRLTLFGTTGEGSSVTVRERIRALEACVESGIDPARLGMGVFALSSEDAIEQVKALAAHQCGHVLLAPPCYFKDVDDEGLYRWLSDVIDKSTGNKDAQFFLYHIPGFTGVPLSVELVQRLAAQFPRQLAGVKDSSGDWGYTERLLAGRGALRILIGHEGDLAHGMRHGAAGAISGMANMIPETIAHVVNSAENDERLGKVIAELNNLPIIPALKTLMAHIYRTPEWARVKPPLSTLDAAAIESLSKTMDTLFPQ